jgi:hypothetical protein
MAGKPKPAFFVIVGHLVVLGLVGFALYRAGILAPKGKDKKVGKIDKKALDKIKGKRRARRRRRRGPDKNAPTTVKEYKFVSSAKLPPVKGVSNYKPSSTKPAR